METLITQRLVEMTFASLDEVANWLTRLGLIVERPEEGVLVIHNPYLQITTALLAESDPVSRAVCLGFALASSAWVSLCPRLLDEVNREWRARRRLATSSPAGEKTPAQKPPPAATPTFAELYKNKNPGQ